MASEKTKDQHAQECQTYPLWPDAGQILGYGKNATYEGARRGEIPTIRIGGKYRVPKVALQRLLESAG
ncbi:MAG: helix-turn-helix domain-containing protein [Candidatus Thiodiazotropha endolucinida]